MSGDGLLVADNLVIAPRGAGSRFITHLLIDCFQLETTSFYDERINEYLHHRSAHKTPGNKNKSKFFWKGEWIDYGTLVDEDRNADEIQCIHYLKKYPGLEYSKNIYYMEAVDELHYVNKLCNYKMFNRSFSYEHPYTIDEERWKDYRIFLQESGMIFEPIHWYFTFYFHNNEKWHWEDLRFNIRRILWDKLDYLLERSVEERFQNMPGHASKFTYTDFINAKTNTELDFYSTEIAEYHQKNLNYIKEFENVFGSIEYPK